MTAPVVRGDETAGGATRLVAVALVAPVAWAVHLGAGVALVPAACETGAEWPLHVLTAVTLVAAVIGALWSRRAAARASGREATRTAFVGRVGFPLGLLFAALIVAEGIPPLVLDPCV